MTTVSLKVFRDTLKNFPATAMVCFEDENGDTSWLPDLLLVDTNDDDIAPKLLAFDPNATVETLLDGTINRDDQLHVYFNGLQFSNFGKSPSPILSFSLLEAGFGVVKCMSAEKNTN